MRTPLLMLLLFVVNLAYAHEPNITDTNIKLGYSTVSVVYTLPDEKRDQERYSEADIKEGFRITNNDSHCVITSFDQSSLDSIGSTQYVYRFNCSEKLVELDIDYSLFSTVVSHKNYSRLSIANRHQSFVFSSDYSHHVVPIEKLLSAWNIALGDDRKTEPNTAMALLDSISYFDVGFFHILEGYDHILFLLGLILLPLRIKSILLITATFTVAHSITLAISVTQDVNIPSWIIESGIAFSIVYVGFENFIYWKNNANSTARSFVGLRRLMLVFVFGLIHGFGFSYLLKEIGFENQLAGALLFFNLGVEAGQLLILSMVVPIMYLLYRYRLGVAFSKAGSLGIMLLGSVWLIERLA